MEHVKKVAVERAVILLQGAGAQFKIIIDDQQYGDLEVCKPKKPKTVRKFKHSGLKYKPIYGPVMDGMQPGDCKTIVCPDGYNMNSLRNVVSSAAVHLWGPGNAITAHRPDGVEVLRLK